MDRPRNVSVVSLAPDASPDSLGGVTDASEGTFDSPRSSPVAPVALSPDQRLVKLGHAIQFLSNSTFAIVSRTREEDLSSIDLFNSESMPDEVRETIVRAVASAARRIEGEFSDDLA